MKRNILATFLACLVFVLPLAGGDFAGVGVAGAEPGTLYKPQDIDNARRNLERHEWAQRIVSGWKESVAFAVEQDREFFEELIPELTLGSSYTNGCPACVDPGLNRATGNLHWRVSDPDRLTCANCGTVFPNPEYPETGVLELPRMEQIITYYQTPGERALPADATDTERAEHAMLGVSNLPTMVSMSSLIRYYRAQWAWEQVLTLAKLYAVTGEIGYAERSLWILDRFARVFPNYLYKSYIGSYADWPPAEVAAGMGDPAAPRGGRFPPGAVRHAYGLKRQHTGSDAKGEYSTLYNGFWGAGRLHTHGKGSDSGPLLNMIIAYDLVRGACYPDGRSLADEAVHRRIVEDLIDAGCADVEHWDDLSNKGVTSRSVSAAAGALLKQPERIRRGLDGFREVLRTRYHFDGFYSESPGYAAHNFSNMCELPDLLLGYSDPPGYRPQDGPRMDDFNPFRHGHFSLALESMVRQLGPGNRLPVIGDTHHHSTISPLYAEILAARLGGPYAGLLETITGKPLSEWGSEYSLWYRAPDLQAREEIQLPLRTEWFPGWHVAVLRGGRQASNTALFLNGNEHQRTLRTGHRQNDILSLSYYAFGEEMAADRGYFSGSGHRTPDGRNGQIWTSGTLSHNLVVVDEADQARSQCGSNLELFGLAPGVEVVQARAPAVYPQCDDYRRTCAMVQTPDGGHYVVDLFRVTGGKSHHYTFHSNGTLADLKPAEPEPQPVDLSDAWSLWVKRPRAVAPQTPYTFTWRHNEVNLDLVMLNTSDTVGRIVVTDAPGWRNHTEAARGRPPVQQILVENRARDDAATLATQYAAVIVSYQSDASPVIAARLLANDAKTGVIAVEVQLAGRTDYIVSTMDQERRRYGPVTVAGRFALATVDGEGRGVQGYLLAGGELVCGELKISLPEANTTLKVRSVSERTFHLAERLPPGAVDVGAYLLASGPMPMSEKASRPGTGFEIESFTADTITVCDYPVVECDEVEVLHSGWLCPQH
jgi:hypothetical protein